MGLVGLGLGLGGGAAAAARGALRRTRIVYSTYGSGKTVQFILYSSDTDGDWR